MQKGQNLEQKAPRSSQLAPKTSLMSSPSHTNLRKRTPRKNFDPAQKPPKQRAWSEEEDILLLTLVERLGANNWSEISAKLTGRDPEQCKFRYLFHLNPKIKTGVWSDREHWVAFLSHKLLGSRWSQIHNNLPWRTDNAIKGHWFGYMRRRVNPGLEIKLEKILAEKMNENCAENQVIDGLLKAVKDILFEEEMRNLVKNDKGKAENIKREEIGKVNREKASLKPRKLYSIFDINFISGHYMEEFEAEADYGKELVERSCRRADQSVENSSLHETLTLGELVSTPTFNLFSVDTKDNHYDI